MSATDELKTLEAQSKRFREAAATLKDADPQTASHLTAKAEQAEREAVRIHERQKHGPAIARGVEVATKAMTENERLLQDAIEEAERQHAEHLRKQKQTQQEPKRKIGKRKKQRLQQIEAEEQRIAANGLISRRFDALVDELRKRLGRPLHTLEKLRTKAEACREIAAENKSHRNYAKGLACYNEQLAENRSREAARQLVQMRSRILSGRQKAKTCPDCGTIIPPDELRLVDIRIVCAECADKAKEGSK